MVGSASNFPEINYSRSVRRYRDLLEMISGIMIIRFSMSRRRESPARFGC